jgi:hypothetical protein
VQRQCPHRSILGVLLLKELLARKTCIFAVLTN